MRPLNRRILRKHLIVDGVVAGVAVVIASLVTAFVFWAAKRLHRWLPETDVHIDGHAFSIDSLPEAVTSNGRTVAILFVGVIATGALIFTACVHGCLGAATVRTYLGAGLTRREFFGMHIRASLSNTAAVASFGLAAGPPPAPPPCGPGGVLLQAAVAGDASGRLTLTHTEQTASSWILLLAAITSSLGAYWLGFTVASLFVRFPWYIPAAGLLALSMVEGLVRLFRYGAYDATKPFASNSMRMIALDGAEALAWTAAGVVVSWLLIRRLPIRR
jgi:membrane protein